jgi:hypothetical protein
LREKENSMGRLDGKLIIPNWRISSKILTLPETADENAQ